MPYSICKPPAGISRIALYGIDYLTFTSLNEAHVEIPFPQRDIHIRQGDAPLTLQQLQPSAE